MDISCIVLTEEQKLLIKQYDRIKTIKPPILL